MFWYFLSIVYMAGLLFYLSIGVKRMDYIMLVCKTQGEAHFLVVLSSILWPLMLLLAIMGMWRHDD